MKLTDLFAKGYYINLDRRLDRKLEFEEEMGSVGLNGFFERVSAHDANIDELTDQWHRKHYYCAASYYKLFQRIYEEGHETVLIFEDDAQFYNTETLSGIELVETALDELQNFPDWEMLYFGGFPFSTMNLVSPHLSQTDNILTCHAVGYKRSAIKNILGIDSGNQRGYIPFEDGAIDSWFGHRDSIKKYLVNPVSIIQRSSISDLDAYGHKQTVHGFLQSYEMATKIKLY